MNTLERIALAAKSNPKRIILPESNDLRIIEAALSVAHQGLAEVVLIGDRA